MDSDSGAQIIDFRFGSGNRAVGKPVRELPWALGSVQEIMRGAAGKRLALFLDYDGTLTPIVDRPELATMSDEMRGTVRALAEHCTVAIISGRDRRDVERMVQIDSLFYAGSHGFDIAGPRGWHVQHTAGDRYIPSIDRAEKALAEELRGVEGTLIERKKYSLAVHYRLVADKDLGAVQESVKGVLANHPELREIAGKKVFELQPRIEWDKGKAVLWLLQALEIDTTTVLPLYLGDDITDEDAFMALKDVGIGIVVGEDSRPTVARYALKCPDEVHDFLRNVIAFLQSKSP